MTGYRWHTLLPLLPHADRTYLAEALGVALSGDELLRALSDQTRIRAAIDALDVDGKELLKRLWLAGGQMSPDQYFRHPGTASLGLFAELAARGLVVQLRIDYYHQVYALPDEAIDPVFEAVVRPDLPLAEAAGDVGPAPAMPIWARDLFRLVSHCRWNQVPLTQQGEIYKRVKQQMAALLWPDHPRDPLERLDYLIRFADWARLIRLDVLHGTVRATDRAAAFWQSTPAARWETYLRYWTEAMLPAMQLGSVVWALLGVAGPAGFDPDELAHVLAGSGLLGQGRARSIVDQVSDFGGRAGLIVRTRDRVFLTADARAALQSRVESESQPSGVIEATGDVLIQAESPPAPLFDAEAVLALHRANVSWIYRFDRVALERAVSLGLDAEEARRRVLAVARTDLPQNVGAEIDDGFRQAGRVRIVTGTVIWARDARTAAIAAEMVRDLDAVEISPGVWITDREAAQEAAARLYKRGLALRATVDVYGARDRYGLVEALDRETPYRPQVQATVPRLARGASEVSPPAFLEAALRSGHPVAIQYQAPGGRSLHVAHARIVSIVNDVIYGLDSYSESPLVLELNRVVRVWHEQ